MEEALLRWGPLFLSFASLVFAISVARSKASDERFGKMEARIAVIDERLSVVEGEIKHLPDREITHRLELAISKLEGRIEVMDERLKPVSEMAKRAQEMVFGEARTA